jgi:hypothetical protein
LQDFYCDVIYKVAIEIIEIVEMAKKKPIKKPPDFAVGDYVFAKIKGFSNWPAEVS